MCGKKQDERKGEAFHDPTSFNLDGQERGKMLHLMLLECNQEPLPA